MMMMRLPSNTRRCTPLECGRGEESCSIDIAQDFLSHSLFVRLILWSGRLKANEVHSELLDLPIQQERLGFRNAIVFVKM